MKIKLVTNHPSERLLWQHRIMNCQPPEAIEWLTDDDAGPEKIIWIISDEAGLRAYDQAQFHKRRMKVSSFVILAEAFKGVVEEKAYQETVNKMELSAEALLCEADYTPGVLRQCLFKPASKPDSVGLNWWRRRSLPSALLNKSISWAKKPQHVKLCVSGPAALAYELGAMFSLQTDCHVLVIDLDRLTPTADLYTGVKAILEGQYEFFNRATATGLNVLLDCAKKGNLQKEVFSKCTQTVKGYEQLHVLSGVYQLADYEYYRAEDIKMIVERASGYYDVILMRTNGFIYDGFTLMAQKLADLIITGLEPDIAMVRAYRQTVHLLKEKQGIPLSAQYWVLAEMRKASAIEIAFYENLAGSNCMGRIPYFLERQRCTATGEYYLSRYEHQLIADYRGLMQAIEKAMVVV